MAIFAQISNIIVYNAPLSGFPLEFCNSGEVLKLERYPHQNVKKCDDMSIHVYTISALTDRQTDWRTDLP